MDAGYPGTGSIRYPEDAVIPLPTGETVTIKRVLTLEQATNLENQGGYHSETHEVQFDKFVMIDLQQEEQIERAFKFPLSYAGSIDVETDAPGAGEYLRINAAGTAMEWATIGSAGAIAAYDTVSEDVDFTVGSAGVLSDYARGDHIHFLPTLPLAKLPTITIAKGGTGATTASAARTTLGLGTAAVVDTGVANGNAVVADATGLPVIDGSQVTGLAWANITGRTVPEIQTFTSSGTWTKPLGATEVLVRLWGAGGSGGTASVSAGGGGGGGAYVEKWFAASDLGATEAVGIGAGGVAITAASTPGNDGGNSTFDTLTAYGGAGGGGGGGLHWGGGGGGGILSVGETPAVDQTGGEGGEPVVRGANGNAVGGGQFGGGFGGDDNVPGASSAWGGGGGGGGSSAGLGVGGDSFLGGAGGGGGNADSSPPGIAGGTSLYGGNGGAGGYDTNNGSAGTAPGGGGGGAETGDSGAGTDGQCIVITW
jgi:hypothetical protein